MEDWTTIQFAELPDLSTRQAMLSWIEEQTHGRCLHFNTTDVFGRRTYGFRFQRRDDATSFQQRWVKPRLIASACDA